MKAVMSSKKTPNNLECSRTAYRSKVSHACETILLDLPSLHYYIFFQQHGIKNCHLISMCFSDQEIFVIYYFYSGAAAAGSHCCRNRSDVQENTHVWQTIKR